jgi:hypothetical protein
LSIRDTAHLVLDEIMNDDEIGGDPCTITSPVGFTLPFRAFNTDIHLSIDPGTDQQVTGRQSSIAVMISELMAVGFESICGIPDRTSRPWVVTIADVNGIDRTFKVASTAPDYSAGMMILFLEAYQ